MMTPILPPDSSARPRVAPSEPQSAGLPHGLRRRRPHQRRRQAAPTALSPTTHGADPRPVDPVPLTALYTRTAGQLAGLAAKFLPDGSWVGPEDIVQDAFDRVWLAWARLGALDDDRALAYLRQTVVNMARSAGRRETVATRHRHEFATPASTVSAEASALARLVDRDLAAALAKLPPRHRQAVLARHWLDWSERDTAAAMGCSVGAVKAYTSRGLGAMRAHLAQRSSATLSSEAETADGADPSAGQRPGG
jgi:RNA polymerase sigma factor (sigma-70 family)